MEPASVPQRTTPVSESHTVSATSGQCGPYTPGEAIDQRVILRKPMRPRTPPSTRPVRTSRRMTRHQSPSLSSPTASARMMSVAAWEPELPPLLMMRGTKMASTTARAISSSNRPMAVAVSISLRNKTRSHPARLRMRLQKGVVV